MLRLSEIDNGCCRFVTDRFYLCAKFTLHMQSLDFYEGVIKQTDASSALVRQQLSEATAENLELQRLIMNQDVHKHETSTKLRIMEVGLPMHLD